MLQMKKLNNAITGELLSQSSLRKPSTSKDLVMSELEPWVNQKVAQLRLRRNEKAVEEGGLSRFVESLDRCVLTDKPELIDRDDFPEHKKVRIIRALHRQNQLLNTYGRTLNHLLPLILRVNEEENRTATILELGSGSGDFALSLAEEINQRGIDAAVTASDLLPEYVEEGNRRAEKKGVDVDFIQLNAFDMQKIPSQSFDIVFIAQSIHHFSPGQLAMMIAQSARVMKKVFVGIDGYRSLGVLGLLSAIWGPTVLFDSSIFHDAFTSARKFYSNAELEFIARLAVPNLDPMVYTLNPGFSVLRVDAD